MMLLDEATIVMMMMTMMTMTMMIKAKPLA